MEEKRFGNRIEECGECQQHFPCHGLGGMGKLVAPFLEFSKRRTFLRECIHFAVKARKGARRLKVGKSLFIIEWKFLGTEE